MVKCRGPVFPPGQRALFVLPGQLLPALRIKEHRCWCYWAVCSQESHFTQKTQQKQLFPFNRKRRYLCAESKRGHFMSPSVSGTGLLPSTTSPKSRRYKGERPEILWGHKCPIEMSWAHEFRNIFCQVSKIWDNNMKVSSSFLKRLPFIFIPGKWEP